MLSHERNSQERTCSVALQWTRVPRPTANGEIWLFDKHHTNYIPLSVTDLRRWIGKPSILVLDFSGAGVLLPFLTSTLNDVSESSQAGWNLRLMFEVALSVLPWELGAMVVVHQSIAINQIRAG